MLNEFFQRVTAAVQRARLAGLRIGTVLLLSTFIDDGIREVSDFHAQLGYLSNPLNHIRLTGVAGYMYVAWSMATQLLAGGYLLACVLLSPSALLAPAAERRTWQYVRPSLYLLAAFVASSAVVYGLGQPASQHAQGRLVFLLRNVGILGGVLLLLAEGRPGARSRPQLQLAARVAIALHGLELAPSSDGRDPY